MRYRAKNIYGWGEFSDSAPLLTVQAPGKPDPIFASILSSQVQISWTEPLFYESPIIRYEVIFKTSQGTYAADDTYCREETTTSCLIPMLQLTNPTRDFNLPLNTFIQAKVRAVNNLGPGEYSDANTDQNSPNTAYVKTVPQDPLVAPSRSSDL